MSTKNGLNKVVSWFVVREPEEAEAQDAAPLASPVPEVEGEAGQPPASPLGEGAGFSEVYGAAGLAPEQLERVERALELLRTLPAAVPVEARRAIVTASLSAFGIPLERILETAGAELRAIDAHVAAGRGRVEASLAGARSRIEALEAEIAAIRGQMAEEARRQEAVSAAAEAERARVRALFEFFGKGSAEAQGDPRDARSVSRGP